MAKDIKEKEKSKEELDEELTTRLLDCVYYMEAILRKNAKITQDDLMGIIKTCGAMRGAAHNWWLALGAEEIQKSEQDETEEHTV